MEVQKRMEKWSQDEQFLSYARKRMLEEINHVPENHRLDELFEELDEGFEWDDRYVVPMVEYLAYRLHVAKLQKRTCKRLRGIWWVFVQVSLQGYYVDIFEESYAPLLRELQETIMPLLHDEYVRRKNNKQQ
ncbi:hypothetical protein [Alistipes putredinis]|uniref:hypothetical protein n=1 Tax=Alistipes putredinis TaxID=28117 RepID=UPI003AB5B647